MNDSKPMLTEAIYIKDVETQTWLARNFGPWDLIKSKQWAMHEVEDTEKMYICESKYLIT